MKQKEDISDEFYDEKLRKLFALEPVISKKSKAKWKWYMISYVNTEWIYVAHRQRKYINNCNL